MLGTRGTSIGGDAGKDEDDDDKNKKKESNPTNKTSKKEVTSTEEEQQKEPILEIAKEMATPTTPTSNSKMGMPKHSLIPFSTTIGKEIKSIFSTQEVEAIDWTTFVNKTPSLLEYQGRLLSRVIDSGDIRLVHMPFKIGKLDKSTLTTIVDVEMKNTLILDHSRFLVISSLATRNSFQSMENKIEKLNKNI